MCGPILFSSICTFQPSPIPPPLSPFPSPQTHNTGNFSGTFSGYSGGAYAEHVVVVEVILPYVLPVNIYHFTKTIFKCLDKNVQSNPTGVKEKGISGRAGTRALALAFLFCGSVQGIMTIYEI